MGKATIRRLIEGVIVTIPSLEAYLNKEDGVSYRYREEKVNNLTCNSHRDIVNLLTMPLLRASSMTNAALRRLSYLIAELILEKISCEKVLTPEEEGQFREILKPALVRLAQNEIAFPALFDFVLDPTTRISLHNFNPLNPSEQARGLYRHSSDPSSGVIKLFMLPDFNELREWEGNFLGQRQFIGTIAHEIGHAVIHRLFRNRTNPYYLDDQKNAKAFNRIVENVLAISASSLHKDAAHTKNSRNCAYQIHNDGILSLPGLYPEENLSAELIVTILEAIGSYPEACTPDELRKSFAGLSEWHKELLEYFENEVNNRLLIRRLERSYLLRGDDEIAASSQAIFGRYMPSLVKLDPNQTELIWKGWCDLYPQRCVYQTPKPLQYQPYQDSLLEEYNPAPGVENGPNPSGFFNSLPSTYVAYAFAFIAAAYAIWFMFGRGKGSQDAKLKLHFSDETRSDGVLPGPTPLLSSSEGNKDRSSHGR